MTLIELRDVAGRLFQVNLDNISAITDNKKGYGSQVHSVLVVGTLEIQFKETPQELYVKLHEKRMGKP